jgi:hypothetical protein
MTSRKSYSIFRIPDDDWNNITETVTLDGSYSEEIKNEIWNALENITTLSDPWVVIQVTEGGSARANLFADKKAAQKYAKRVKKNLPKNKLLLCVRAPFKQSS